MTVDRVLIITMALGIVTIILMIVDATQATTQTQSRSNSA